MKSNCENCMNFVYDEEYECYTCLMNFDEDDVSRFVRNTPKPCPYFRYGDEYKIVNKQI